MASYNEYICDRFCLWFAAGQGFCLAAVQWFCPGNSHFNATGLITKDIKILDRVDIFFNL